MPQMVTDETDEILQKLKDLQVNDLKKVEDE
jgi:hypothetical protein